MWNTPMGPRKLVGAERRVFVNAFIRATTFFDLDDFKFDMPILDQIHPEDRYPAFIMVAAQLLTDAPAQRDPHAWQDAVLNEMYEQMVANVEIEIDEQKMSPKDYITFSRRLVLAASKEAHLDHVSPGVRSKDVDHWELLLTQLRKRVLPSLDYVVYDDIMDLSVRKARKVLRKKNLPDDYFQAIPPSFDASARKTLMNFGSNLAVEDNAMFDRYMAKARKELPF